MVRCGGSGAAAVLTSCRELGKPINPDRDCIAFIRVMC